MQASNHIAPHTQAHHINVNQLNIADRIFSAFNAKMRSYSGPDWLAATRETLAGEYISLNCDIHPWPHYSTATLEFESEGYRTTIYAILTRGGADTELEVAQLAIWSDDADEFIITDAH